MLNKKYKKFAEHYVETNNAKESAIVAGYSEKVAYSTGPRLLRNPDILAYITKLNQRIDLKKVATVQEIREFLTKVIRGEITEKEFIEEKNGITQKTGKKMMMRKGTRVQDRLKAVELLGKTYGMFDPLQAEEVTPVVIVGENLLEE